MYLRAKLWQAVVITGLLFCISVEPIQAWRTDEVAGRLGTGRARDNAEVPEAWITTRDGEQFIGKLDTESLSFSIGAETRQIEVSDLLSFHSAEPASAKETERITAGLEVLAGTDLQACETASAELTDIGLPLMSPLLKGFQDTDAHEPDYRYRLFGRIVPGHADSSDRTLDLIRLVGRDVLRGKLTAAELKLAGADGKTQTVPTASIRRLAVRQANISKTFELHALHHCSYVGFLDTGIAVDEDSALRADCKGFARLSFDEDGWASDPDGIVDPLPGKRKLQEGFRWGAVLGRVGPTGERWFAGKHFEKKGLGTGRLYFVINDNEHWQNNIGSFRMLVTVSNAYDVGEPQ